MLHLKSFVLWLKLVCLLGFCSAGYLENTYPPSVVEDTHLDMFGETHKYDYPLEEHFVTTEDKYILRLFRLARPQARPVFLMHGLLDSSITWLLNGPWGGLGYYLYDLGYDVWMGNARGNFYSRNHTVYNPDVDKEFWTFSWHEIGVYDLPASIDYVLEKTGFDKLAYYGHSQGTTSFFVMASMRPEYNQKITLMSALAPVAYFKNNKKPLVLLLKNFIAVAGNVLGEFLPRSNLSKTCLLTKSTENVCLNNLYNLMGKDPNMLNMTRLPVYLTHFPSGCNFKQAEHYAQLIESGRFCQYDYGSTENQKRYNSPQPPDYPLKNIVAPVALYYAYNDNLSNYKDVIGLSKQLPNVAENLLYPDKNWTHASMEWGLHARELAHEHMVEVMRKFEV